MNQPSQTHHLLAELAGCQKNRELFTQGDKLVAEVSRLVREAGLTLVGQQSHEFPAGGVTCSLLLAESHLNLHTWPERGFVINLDLLVCNFRQDNRAKAQGLWSRLLELFEPQRVKLQQLQDYQPLFP